MERETRPRAVNIALILVAAGLLIQVLNALRMLHGIQFMANNPRWLAIHYAAPLIMAVAFYALTRARNWARLVLLIVTLANFLELCWGIGYLLRSHPEDLRGLLIPSFLFWRVLPLILHLAALHLLYFSSGDWFGRRK